MGAEIKKVAVIASLLIFILILSIISFGAAWWRVKGEMNVGDGDFKFSSESNFKLEEVEMETRQSYQDEESSDKNSYDYDDEDLEDAGFNNVIGLYGIIYNLMIVILILITISIICAVLALNKKVFFKLLSAVLIVTFIFTLLTAVVFAIGLPMALDQDFEELVVEINGEEVTDGIEIEKPLYTEHFAGEETRDDDTLTWGPSTGWSLMVLVFILTGLCAIVALLPLKRPGVEKSVPEPPIRIQDDYKDAIVMDEPEITYDKKNIFECPSCGKEFKVSTPQRPVRIRCPHCKTEGTIS